MNIVSDLQMLADSVKKLTFSERKATNYEYARVVARPFLSKGEIRWQLEQYKGTQVFHKNVSFRELLDWVESVGVPSFRQAVLVAAGQQIHYTIFPDKIKRKAASNAVSASPAPTHDRKKQYLLNEGENIPALVDLGVFTPDFKIVKSKFDKFKQINRFLALIDDRFAQTKQTEMTILDFGCGKSYLTFILYHYFTRMKHVKATVLGALI